MRILLDIYDSHNCIGEVCKLIGKINSGNMNISPLEFACWLDVAKILAPLTYEGVEWKQEGTTLVLMHRAGSFIKTFVELTFKK